MTMMRISGDCGWSQFADAAKRQKIDRAEIGNRFCDPLSSI